jgi:hypothetical protein
MRMNFSTMVEGRRSKVEGRNSRPGGRLSTPDSRIGRRLTLFLKRQFGLARTGIWKDALTRRLESLRHVAAVGQTFLSAGSRNFPVPGGGWKTAGTRRLESLRYQTVGLPPQGGHSCLPVGATFESPVGSPDWKVRGTRRLESLRYVAQTFLSAGFGDFRVPGFRVKLSALVREVGKLRNRQARKPALQFGQHAPKLRPPGSRLPNPALR